MIRLDTLPSSAYALLVIGGTIVSSAEGYQCVWNFAPQNQYDTSDGVLAETTGIDTADFNGDGLLDVAVSNRKTDEVMLFAGDGAGNLAFLSRASVGVGAIPRYVVAGDFDGDGDLDAATANWEGGSSPTYLGGSVSILLNDGIGNLSVSDELFYYRSSCIAVSDIDGDGDPDLIVPHWDPANGSSGPGITTILLNNGDATFNGIDVPIGRLPRGVDVGDLDSDGDLDFAVSNLGDNTVTIIENLGGGTFATVASVSTGLEPRYVAIGDLDQDGLGDLAVVHKTNNELWIMKNQGGMVFLGIGTYPTSINPHSTTIDDINGDCNLDVIVSHVGANWVYVYENDGFGAIVNTVQILSLKGPAHVITADINEDGRSDLLTADANDGGYTSIHLNNVHQGACGCNGDLTLDGSVDVLDVLELLGGWGSCQPQSCCTSDLTGDGFTNVMDLLEIIGLWGPCVRQ
ncbi:VCBS repeat-containing protein [PVC group bacterium]|nr:VCBS repeat-containing protein [PVC group bacterium]